MNQPRILNRLPSTRDALTVLSFAAFLVYGRMFYIFAWKLPSWIKYLTVGEILSILSYALAIAMLESVVYVLCPALVGFLLPRHWLRDDFIPRSVWAIAVWQASWMIYFSRMNALGVENGFIVLNYLYTWLAVTLALMLIAAWLGGRVRFLARCALWLADRTLVFLFVLVPASLIGLLVTIIRNLS